MDGSLISDELRCRAAVYRLLARLWKQELDAATLQELRRGSVSKSYVAAGGSLPEVVDQDTLCALALDFCQLFIGPTGHLPPYQSIWSQGKFHGLPLESMRGYLEAFDTRRWDHENMPDHLAVELEVMAFLLEQLHQVGGKSRCAHNLSQFVTKFFHDHLTWTKTLCGAAAQRAKTDFYRGVIRVTAGFLDTESAAIGERRSLQSSLVSMELGNDI